MLSNLVVPLLWLGMRIRLSMRVFEVDSVRMFALSGMPFEALTVKAGMESKLTGEPKPLGLLSPRLIAAPPARDDNLRLCTCSERPAPALPYLI